MRIRTKKLSSDRLSKLSRLVEKLESSRWVSKMAEEESKKAVQEILKLVGVGFTFVVDGKKVMTSHVRMPDHNVGGYTYNTVIIKKNGVVPKEEKGE